MEISWPQGPAQLSLEVRWKAFVTWCSERGEDPFKTLAASIAEFLQNSFLKSLSWSTVCGYVAVILVFHPAFHENSLEFYKVLKTLLKVSTSLDLISNLL